MPEAALRLSPLACVAALSGCFLFQPPPGTPTGPQGAGEGVLVVEGTVRVGAPGAAGAVSPLTILEPLTVQEPLAGNSGGALIGNTGAALGAIAELADQAPLTATSQLIGNAGAALVGNAGAGLVANSGGAFDGFPAGRWAAARRAAAVGSGDHVLFVEIVDGETAQLLYRTLADERGAYSINLGPARTRRGLVVQATAVRGASVTAFLAAPLPVARGEAGKRKVDATPGSTLALFSQAVLSGVRAELKVGKGFRGFRAGGLAKLLPLGDAAAAGRATDALDRSDAYSKATTFDAVLGAAAEHSAVLARAAAASGLQGGGTIASIVAATNLILSEIAAKPPAAAESLAAFIQASAARVTADAVRKAAGEIQARAAESGEGDAVAAPLATPTPGHADSTPTPGTDATPTPAPGPTPTSDPNGHTVTSLPVGSLGTPRGAALDAAGNIYVRRGQAIGKITPAGVETAVAVKTTDGTAIILEPYGMVFDLAGNLIMAEGTRNLINKLSPDGHLSVLAGGGTAGLVDGASSSARFRIPYGLALDPDGNVLVADAGNNAIRRVAPDGTVTTLVTTANGQGDPLVMPYGVAVAPDGTVYVACYLGHNIVQIKNESASVFAGSGQSGFQDGPKALARFYYPFGVAVAGDGHVLVADSQNRRIRHIDETGTVATHAGTGADGQMDGPALDATFTGPAAINWAPDGRIIVLDGGKIRIIQ